MYIQEQTKKSNWKEILISGISDKAHAKRVIEKMVKGIYAIAIVQVIVALIAIIVQADSFSAGSAVADAVIYAVLGFLIGRYKSRIAAVVLLLIALAAVFGSISGGASGVLAIVLFIFSIRATWAAFAYHKKELGATLPSAPSATPPEDPSEPTSV